jgi:hypothetical protein
MVLLSRNHIGRAVAALLACAALAAAGCGPSEKLVPVKGKVLWGGQPLASGVVTFVPEDPAAKDKARPMGMLKDGEYTLNTKGKDGAPLGKYLVIVSGSAPMTGTDAPAQPPPPIDPKYQDAVNTPLHVEVVESPQSGAYDLNLVK